MNLTPTLLKKASVNRNNASTTFVVADYSDNEDRGWLDVITDAEVALDEHYEELKKATDFHGILTELSVIKGMVVDIRNKFKSYDARLIEGAQERYDTFVATAKDRINFGAELVTKLSVDKPITAHDLNAKLMKEASDDLVAVCAKYRDARSVDKRFDAQLSTVENCARRIEEYSRPIE